MENEGIELHVDELPPSVNKLYTVRGHRKILSDVGRRYKNRLKSQLAEQLIDYSPFGREAPLSFRYILFFEAVINKGYPDKTDTKFKRIDLSNRIKVLEDIICELLDVDDSQVVHMEVDKWQGKPHVYVRVTKVRNVLIAPQS